MHGISIDDRPDGPVGTPALRRTIAIHWEWTTEYTREEMALALGVSEDTINRYLRGGINEEVKEVIHRVEGEVRLAAVTELKRQLKTAGHRARTAEKPVEVWEEDGEIHVVDQADDTGEIVDRYPVPADYELLPDGEARYYARKEVREILEQLADLTGAAEPEQVEVEHSGIAIYTEAEDADD